MGSRRSAEKEAFWRMVLDEQRASGLSVRAFCRNESLSEASFYAWRKELRKRDGIVFESSSEPPALVPVSIVDSPSPPQRLITETQQPQLLEVTTPGGFTLRFDAQLNVTQLRGLLQVITSCGGSSC